ncbi:MAG: hypothetical protein ACT4TC_25880 [Myxococcaceae bacterium]
MAAEATLSGQARAEREQDRSFLLRRLHSLSGVLPIGGFLCYHIFENMAALRSAEAYDEMVNHVNSMLPRAYFYGLELFGIVGPILFHALYGIYIASTGKANTSRYAYGSNWSYWVQRVSGYFAFAYLILHVGVLRVGVTLLGKHLSAFSPAEGKLDLVTYNDVSAHLGNAAAATGPYAGSWMAGNWVFVAYLMGTLLTIFHFTNGLNGFCWTWGIAVGRVAQKRVQLISWTLFAALSLATLNILFRMRGIL